MSCIDKKCVTCGYVGTVTLKKSLTDSLANVISQGIKIFNLGNNQVTTNEDEAADTILGKEFPKIFELKDISEERFAPGTIGVNQIPKINLSEISDIVEPKQYQALVKRTGQIDLNKAEVQKNVKTIKKETTEREVFSGITKYFEGKNEDVLIFFNQDIQDRNEKDAIVIKDFLTEPLSFRG